MNFSDYFNPIDLQQDIFAFDYNENQLATNILLFNAEQNDLEEYL